MAINANGSTFFRGLHNTPFTIEEISKVGVISDQLQTKYKMESKSVKDRSVACILGVMFGDILGAAVEGFDPELGLLRFFFIFYECWNFKLLMFVIDDVDKLMVCWNLKKIFEIIFYFFCIHSQYCFICGLIILNSVNSC